MHSTDHLFCRNRLKILSFSESSLSTYGHILTEKPVRIPRLLLSSYDGIPLAVETIRNKRKFSRNDQLH